MSKEAVLQIPRLQVLNEITISFNELAKAWNLKEKRYGETTIQHFISRNKDALDFLEIEASCSPDSNRLPRLKLSTSKYVGSVPIVSPENGLPVGNIYVGGRFDEDISELLSVIGDFIPPDFNFQMELSGNFVKPPLFFECQHYIDEYIEAKRYKWRKFDNEEKIRHHPSSSTRWDKYAITSADPHKVLDYTNKCNVLTRTHPEWNELNYVLDLSINEILSNRTPLRSRQAYMNKIKMLKDSYDKHFKMVKSIPVHMADPIIIKSLKETANRILIHQNSSHYAWRIDFAEFFERYIQFMIANVARSKGARLTKNPKYSVSGNKPDWSLNYLEPDIVVDRGDVQYIIDAKYKSHMFNLRNHGDDLKEAFRHDLHQVLAYSSFGRSTRKNVMLIYPSSNYIKRKLIINSGLNSTNCNVYLVGVPMKKSEMESVKSSLKEIISFDG